MSLSDPLMVALLNKLPPIGAEWSLDARCRWMQACEAILNVVYGPVEKIDIAGLLPEQKQAVGTIVTAISEENVRRASAPEPPAYSPPSDKIVIEPKVPPLKPVTGPPAKSIGRPDNIPSNLAMAVEAITELGPASAPQIRNYIRKKHWPDLADHWSANLYEMVSSGKLARSGMNFVLPAKSESAKVEAPVGLPKIAAEIMRRESVPSKSPAPKPTKPAAPRAKPDVGVGFNHNNRSTVLASSREYVLAGKLRTAMGSGHISEAFLADKVLGSNTENNRLIVRDLCLRMNAALGDVGLKIEHYPGFGLIMKELA